MPVKKASRGELAAEQEPRTSDIEDARLVLLSEVHEDVLGEAHQVGEVGGLPHNVLSMAAAEVQPAPSQVHIVLDVAVAEYSMSAVCIGC